MTPTQKASRDRITARDYKRRALGKSHADRGIYIPYGEVSMPHHEIAPIAGPDGRSKGERWCERCKRVGRIMYWMEKRRFRCCGWPA